MKYELIYNKIIQNRLLNPVTDEYTECHHIIPRSLGGTDDKDNLVELLAREHFICHLLLTKMYEEGSNEWIKMVKAFMRMYSFNSYQERYSNNKWYEYLKKSFSKAQSLNQNGKNNSSYGTIWISNVSERKCIKINKEHLQEYIANGWIQKRILNWDRYEIEDGVLKSNYIQPSRREVYERTKKKIIEKTDQFNLYWKIYKEHTFEEFVKITGYDKTLESLIDNFHRYVKDYVPKQGNYKKK